ncbi:MAG: hypothetical protein AAGI10_10650 [Pseudomonadota bacterium]
MDLIDIVTNYWPMIAALLGAAIIVPWRKSKGKTSIFAQDTSFDDVGTTLLSTVGSQEVRKGVDGRTEMRPPFGYRVLTPAVMALVVLSFDERALMADMGLTNPTYQTYAIIGFWVLFAYGLFEMNFRQRVIYDATQITVWGVDLRAQTRDLTQLVDIRVHEKRPALVLTFSDGKRLYVPMHLNGRDHFVTEMEAIVAHNLARGERAPQAGFMARAGF